jgi:hypothetical protein
MRCFCCTCSIHADADAARPPTCSHRCLGVACSSRILSAYCSWSLHATHTNTHAQSNLEFSTHAWCVYCAVQASCTCHANVLTSSSCCNAQLPSQSPAAAAAVGKLLCCYTLSALLTVVYSAAAKCITYCQTHITVKPTSTLLPNPQVS